MRHQRASASSGCNNAGVRLCSLPTILAAPLLLLLLLTNASYFVSGSDEEDASTAGYCRLCERHTMCLFPYDDVSSKCIEVENGDLDPEEIRSIVHRHNVYRNNIARGLEKRGNPGPQPPARNIMALTWDEELAQIARRWAIQCIPFQKDYCRDVERFSVWQNVNIQSLEGTSDGMVEEKLEKDGEPRFEIADETNSTGSTATANAFMRIRMHVESWLNEVEHFDTARVGLVDLSMENETSYVAIACAMITRVGCGRAIYRAYLDEKDDDPEIPVISPEATDNKNDSNGATRLEVLICNYGPIDRSMPVNLYEYGTDEHCPEGSVPSDEYDHLCASGENVVGKSPGETMERRREENEAVNSGWRGIVGSPEWEEEEERSKSRGNIASSAVSIASRESTNVRRSFHALAEFLSLVLLHIITKTRCC